MRSGTLCVSLSRVVSPEEADSIIEIEKEERNRILKIVKEREKRNRESLDPRAKSEPVTLDMTFYEILQRVTAKAKNYPFHTKKQLEKLGGNIIG